MGLVLYALFVLGIVLCATLASSVWSGRFAHHWGTMPGPGRRAGRGAYREALVRVRVPRGVPPLVGWTSGVGMIWAALTSLVFTPMLLVVGGSSDGSSPLEMVAGVGLVVTASSGFFLGVVLACVAFFLLRRDPDAGELADGAVVWSVLHHLAGLLFVILHSVVTPGPGFLVLSAPIWVFGLAHAYAMQDAAHLVTADDEDEPSFG